MEPAKKLTAFVEEFKNFALKGNVIDLAIGVIIGAAFGKIIEFTGKKHHHAVGQSGLARRTRLHGLEITNRG